MTDVKESKEAIKAIVKLVKVVKKAAADGLDLSDAVALGGKLVTDSEFREALVEGVKGAEKMPAEWKDLSLGEVAELLLEAQKEWSAE